MAALNLAQMTELCAVLVRNLYGPFPYKAQTGIAVNTPNTLTVPSNTANQALRDALVTDISGGVITVGIKVGDPLCGQKA